MLVALPFQQLQETKIQNLLKEDAFSLLGGSEVEWIVNDSLGRSGCPIIMCKEGIFNLNFSFIGELLVGIDVTFKCLSIY